MFQLRLATYILFAALASPALCGRNPALRGRTLLQPGTQIPPACSNGFTQAYPFCADATARFPGSLCCTGLAAIGGDCLDAVQGSLSASSGDGTAASTLTATLAACGIGGPGTSPSPVVNCTDAFAQELTACGSGTACCAPVQALGVSCLAELASTTDVFQSVAFTQLRGLCGWNITDSGGGGKNGSEPLPAGNIRSAWSTLGTSGAPCPVFNGTDFENGSEPKWVASGSDFPTDAQVKALGARWCNSTASNAIVDLMASLAAGGKQAQVAVATYLLYSCPSNTDGRLYDLMSDAINAPELNSQDTTVQYMQAFVDACDRSGISACATVVVTNKTDGDIAAYQNIHVGSQPGSAEGCLPNFLQAEVVCNVTAAPAEPCCANVEALGDACRSSLEGNADTDVQDAYSAIAEACGSFDGSDGSDGSLPAGDVLTRFTSGGTAQCLKLDTWTMKWNPVAGSTWGPTSNEPLSQTAIEDFANQMCPLAHNAGPLLVQALDAGGDDAKIAVYALTTQNVCADAAQQKDAYHALVNMPEMVDSNTVLGLVHSFVQGCDVTGAGCCVSVFVLDPSTQEVLHEEYVHTGVQVSDPATTMARSFSVVEKPVMSLAGGGSS